jgi:hypothetical protein
MGRWLSEHAAAVVYGTSWASRNGWRSCERLSLSTANGGKYASDWGIAEHVRHGAEPPLVMGARYQLRFVTSDACPAILA